MDYGFDETDLNAIDDNNNRRKTPSRDGGTLGNSGLSGSGPSSNRMMMDGSSSNHSSGATVTINIDLEHEVANESRTLENNFE